MLFVVMIWINGAIGDDFCCNHCWSLWLWNWKKHMIRVHDLAHGCGILDLIILDVRSRDTEETSLEVDVSASTHSGQWRLHTRSQIPSMRVRVSKKTWGNHGKPLGTTHFFSSWKGLEYDVPNYVEASMYFLLYNLGFHVVSSRDTHVVSFRDSHKNPENRFDSIKWVCRRATVFFARPPCSDKPTISYYRLYIIYIYG